MAFKLALATFTQGTEPTAAKELATLKHLVTLAAPVTAANMRTDLETSQFQAFSNEGWDAFMAQMAAINLDTSVLTAAELSIVAEIRTYVNPPPGYDCCGVTPVVSGLTSFGATALLGSATWQHIIEVKLDPSTSCDIKSIDVTLTGVPATVPLTFKCLFQECTTGGRIFRYYYTTYAGDPAGVAYAVNLDFKDADDVTIDTFVPTYSPYTFP
jgi:hypothetical protein